MALGGAAAVFISQQASKAGVTPAVNRQATPTREDQNKTAPTKDGEEPDSTFGALFNRGPQNDATVQERPERQAKLREQRVQTPKSEVKAEQTQNRTTRTEEGAAPEGSAKLAKENKIVQLWGRDTRWITQTKFDSNQNSGQPRLSEMGQRRMQAFYINRLVGDNFQQHTGGKADEPYSRAQYRQILGALSTVVGSGQQKTTRQNDGSRSSEPNTAASLGRKMNDANRVQQIFEPPAPPPADYEPLELVA